MEPRVALSHEKTYFGLIYLIYYKYRLLEIWFQKSYLLIASVFVQPQIQLTNVV